MKRIPRYAPGTFLLVGAAGHVGAATRASRSVVLALALAGCTVALAVPSASQAAVSTTVVYTDGVPAPAAQWCTGAGCTGAGDFYSGKRGVTGADGELLIAVKDGTIIELRGYGVSAPVTWTASSSADPVVLPKVANEYTAPEADSNELQVLAQINARRTSRGLEPLAVSAALSKASDFQATWVTEHNAGGLSHGGPTSIGQRAVESGFPVVNANDITEVLSGAGTTNDPTVPVEGWSQSGMHASAIYDPLARFAGVALVGRTWGVIVARRCPSPTRCATTPTPAVRPVGVSPGDGGGPVPPPPIEHGDPSRDVDCRWRHTSRSAKRVTFRRATCTAAFARTAERARVTIRVGGRIIDRATISPRRTVERVLVPQRYRRSRLDVRVQPRATTTAGTTRRVYPRRR